MHKPDSSDMLFSSFILHKIKLKRANAQKHIIANVSQRNISLHSFFSLFSFTALNASWKKSICTKNLCAERLFSRTVHYIWDVHQLDFSCAILSILSKWRKREMRHDIRRKTRHEAERMNERKGATVRWVPCEGFVASTINNLQRRRQRHFELKLSSSAFYCRARATHLWVLRIFIYD
jgi:hypothetical protein